MMNCIYYMICWLLHVVSCVSSHNLGNEFGFFWWCMLSGVRRSLERLTRGIIGTRRRKGTTLYVVQYCSKTLRGGEGELQKPSLVSMIQQRMCESHLFPTMHVFWDVPGYVPTCLVRERNGHQFEECHSCHESWCSVRVYGRTTNCGARTYLKAWNLNKFETCGQKGELSRLRCSKYLKIMASYWCPKLQNSTESHFETVHHFDRLRGEGKRGCPAQLRTWPQGFRKQEVYNTCNKHSDLQCYSAHKYKYFAIAMLLQSYSRQSVWFFCQINIWWVDHQSWLLQLVHLSTSNWKPLSPSVQSCLRSEHGRCSTLFNIK